jgi:leucyl/phenylalanyl-tRNA--protein transferase
MTSISLDPESLLSAYAQGAFPMADAEGDIRFYSADPRGVIPLDAFHVPHTLAQLVRKPADRGGFEVRINHDFAATMRACMETPRRGGWINETLIAAYTRLHEVGFAHSVEAWRGGELAGGLYGVSLGGAFFGESMFHRQRDASKVALVHLVNRMLERGFVLLDTQANTEHLQRFGCVDLSAREYLKQLRLAIRLPCKFD